MVRSAVSVAIVMLMLTTPVILADDECTATVSPTLTREGDSKLEFEVEITTAESRAKIEYDLIVEIQLPNGQAKRIRKPRFVKVNEGSLTEIVLHRLAEGESMLSYEAKVVRCEKQDPD